MFARFSTFLIAGAAVLSAIAPVMATPSHRVRNVEIARSHNELAARAAPADPHMVEAFNVYKRCGCQQDAPGITVGLYTDISGFLEVLDGVTDPSDCASKIVAAIGAAAEVVAGLDVTVDTPIADVEVAVAIKAVVEIYLAILTAFVKYDISVVLSLLAEIDAALVAFIKVLVKLIPSLIVSIAAALVADVYALVNLHLTASLALLGL
ncbi:hypothetical protein DL93DRAFT_2096178 [Clavulina sp. PMI_390]|nr:hypothetical protein DL93DRAFT_2096178 [Clavulina sp. PMI_390]